MRPLIINRHTLSWTVGEHGRYLPTPPESRTLLTRTFGGGLEGYRSADFPDVTICDMTRKGHLEAVATWLISSRQLTHIVALHEKEMILAASLRERYGLPGMTQAETLPFRDKLRMKDDLVAAGYENVPAYLPVPATVPAAVPWTGPTVVKSRWGLGASEVRVVDAPAGIAGAIAELNADPATLEIEQFVAGTMYHCDSVVFDGEVRFGSVCEYLQPPGRFAVERYQGSVLLGDGPVRNLLAEHNAKVLRGLGIRAGVTHAEFFLTPAGDVVFCEVAARPGGGGISDIVRLSYGVDLVENAVHLQLGLPPVLPDPPDHTAGSDVYGVLGIFQYVLVEDLGSFLTSRVPGIVSYGFLPPELPGRVRHATDYGHKLILQAPSRSEFDERLALVLSLLESKCRERS
ncbi:ATP-grasp domain-containing protein [Jatrophihabitans sp.]|uniref:ATP-grasp domain-containing protein n=1 Tax=Jatrophihabitans sp. TaxID=1932789 RepID=UPI002BC7F643|nr:hypothetical protein [Jatrophihabitans sp.]